MCFYVLPIDKPSYGIVHVVRQAIDGRCERVGSVDYGWLMIFLFEVAFLLGRKESSGGMLVLVMMELVVLIFVMLVVLVLLVMLVLVVLLVIMVLVLLVQVQP